MITCILGTPDKWTQEEDSIEELREWAQGVVREQQRVEECEAEFSRLETAVINLSRTM